MRLRAGNHGATASAKAFTIAVMAAATLAQLFSISHEMTVRHFRCAEHGELTHVAAIVGNQGAGPAAVPAQRANDALRAQGSQTADAHEHCGVAFTVEGSSCAPSAGGAIGTISPRPAVRPAERPVALGGQAGVLASAPKTSPPSA